MNLRHSITLGILSLATVVAGCGRPISYEPPADKAKATAHGHSHDAWWCNEHGVPEEVCALCDPKLVADFKAKGDWCDKHDRPDSQCFICHPEKEAEFAAQYEAKYGKQPPKPEATEGQKADEPKS